ncbi:MAG: 2Fe-2S iron-sulfur cluster-binding protein [Gammaproteobacteria bacterium]|nr:2Fe-2S iron-sulfur cluster-binding protein [Gammaproteobacteria bacterium]
MARITFITPNGDEYAVDGIGMSLMQLATSQNIPGIIGECGGVLSCATCHVHVEPRWYRKLTPPAKAECDMLVFAEQVGETSRLCCQIKVRDDLDGMVVRVPQEG